VFPALDPIKPVNRCTELPSSVVDRDTCGQFNLVNEIREDPSSFIPVLAKRLEELKATKDVQMVSISMVPSPLEKDEASYENLVAIERAISVLRRTPPVPSLEWSDALFLSSKNHCEAQKEDTTPSLFMNFMSPEGEFLGKARPARAVQEYANATGVELAISVGDRAIDQVIRSLVDADTRSIVLNPFSKFTGIQRCTNVHGLSYSVQNFASSATINAKGKEWKELLMTTEEIIDECDDSTKGLA